MRLHLPNVGKHLRGLIGVLLLSILGAGIPAIAADTGLPKPGIELRVASYQPCPACEALETADGTPVYLQRRPLIVSSDIARITKDFDSTNGLPVLVIEFRPEAHLRIARDTQENIGHDLALVADGTIITIARLAGPFSSSMMLAGIDHMQQQATQYDALTVHKQRKRLLPRKTP